MNTPRAILFDLDGTLIDSLPDIVDALNRALAHLGLKRAAAREVRTWIGDGVRTLCQRALAQQNALEKLDDLVVRMTRAYATTPCARTRCFPNVLKMLDLLNEHQVATAVITNKPHDLALRVVAALELTRRIQVIRGYQTEADKKPAPIGALEVAEALECDPRDCAIVGDSIIDIATARNANMRAIAVIWGYQERSKLLAAGPDAVLDDPLEIKKLLGPSA
ncbi:MAG TPA: HAD-IA family hydrolase [Phycisphaerae bacterium]|nr:HAD-IA family hydrolase [Phycisphaerae bacterium]